MGRVRECVKHYSWFVACIALSLGLAAPVLALSGSSGSPSDPGYCAAPYPGTHLPPGCNGQTSGPSYSSPSGTTTYPDYSNMPDCAPGKYPSMEAPCKPTQTSPSGGSSGGSSGDSSGDTRPGDSNSGDTKPGGSNGSPQCGPPPGSGGQGGHVSGFAESGPGSDQHQGQSPCGPPDKEDIPSFMFNKVFTLKCTDASYDKAKGLLNVSVSDLMKGPQSSDQIFEDINVFVKVVKAPPATKVYKDGERLKADEIDDALDAADKVTVRGTLMKSWVREPDSGEPTPTFKAKRITLM